MISCGACKVYAFKHCTCDKDATYYLPEAWNKAKVGDKITQSHFHESMFIKRGTCYRSAINKFVKKFNRTSMPADLALSQYWIIKKEGEAD